MYAIVNIAGKQYKVSKGDTIQTATIDSKPGDKLTFDKVLATDDGKSMTIGNPFIKNTTVSAKLIDHGRTKKILVYKKKRRKGYERKNTHRQGFSTIQIQNITTKKPVATKTKKKEEIKVTEKKTSVKKTTKKTTTVKNAKTKEAK